MKQLRRSVDDRIAGGICAGIGRDYDLDPNLVRLIVVFVTLLTGIIPLLVTYLVGCWLIPQESEF